MPPRPCPFDAIILAGGRGRRTAALRAAARGYPGRSLHGLLGPLRPVLLRYHRAGAEPPPWLDCDTPEDLRRARAWSAQEASP